MEQVRLRVGDTLDDYCPRERRLTTHAVVALVEDRVKLTRCMTCEFEHAFKDGKLPVRRKKPESTVALSPQVVDSAVSPQIVAAQPRRHAPPPSASPQVTVGRSSDVVAVAPFPRAARDDRELVTPAVADAAESPDARLDLHEASVHRRLIRATLPRQEGQPPTPRPIPEFTIRHAASPGHGRRTADGHRSSGNGKFRADRNHFGAPRHSAHPGQRGGNQGARFGKKGPR